jgi:hypothetical protein
VSFEMPSNDAQRTQMGRAADARTATRRGVRCASCNQTTRGWRRTSSRDCRAAPAGHVVVDKRIPYQSFGDTSITILR